MGQERGKVRYIWLSVPLFAFGGIILSLILFWAGILPEGTAGLLNPGITGNVIGSFILAYFAIRKQTKDIVALFVPVYAVIILLLDEYTGKMLLLQVLYAASLLILVIRLEKKFT
jgi:hypothetical protein